MAMRLTNFWVYCGLLLLIFFIVITTVGVGMLSRGGARNIRIGEETTHITEPIGEDGMVDYMAALNRQNSANVTPSNNAAVALLHAFGPGVLEGPLRSQYFAELGISPLPLEGDYYLTVKWVAALQGELVNEAATVQATIPGPTGEFGRADDALPELNPEEQMSKCLTRAWVPTEFPIVDAWLAQNVEPLRWIVDASQRERFFMPMLTEEDSPAMVPALLPMLHHYRSAVRLLCVRATKSCGEGDVDAALRDCVRAIRLARLQGRQSSYLVDSLVAHACQRIACIALEAIAATPEATPQQLRLVLAQLDELPAMNPIWRQIDRGERYFYLSSVTMIADRGPSSLVGFPQNIPSSRSSTITSAAIDWNIVLKNGNEWYDTVVRVGRQPDFQQFQKESSVLDARLEAAVARVQTIGVVRSLATMTGRCQLMSDVIINLHLSAVNATFRVEFRAAMQMELTKMSLRLAVYRQEQGEYPTALNEMVPEYCDEVPTDIFDALPIKYRRSGDGYVLYSIGVHEVDNGGIAIGTTLRDPNGDFVVRINAPTEE